MDPLNHIIFESHTLPEYEDIGASSSVEVVKIVLSVGIANLSFKIKKKNNRDELNPDYVTDVWVSLPPTHLMFSTYSSPEHPQHLPASLSILRGVICAGRDDRRLPCPCRVISPSFTEHIGLVTSGSSRSPSGMVAFSSHQL